MSLPKNHWRQALERCERRVRPDRVYDTQDVAAALDLLLGTVTAECRKGNLPAVKPADRKTWRVRGSDLLAYARRMAAREQGRTPGPPKAA